MYKDRIDLYQKIQDIRDSTLITYITGDRPGLETQIHSEVLQFFTEHLDKIKYSPKISLYLYTRGGETLAAWSIAHLIRQFCDDFEVLIPSKAHSAGTLICLGACDIVMTKQATLGPIDPSVNTPLNPPVPGGPPEARIPVSVEAINGFIELIKQTGIDSSEDLAKVMSNLTSYVHPLVLGEVYRTRSQIRMLGKRLLSKQMDDGDKIEKILDFLCSESGSHDYTIYRQEARDGLGLKVSRPDDALYDIMKKIYDDISDELKLTEHYYPEIMLGDKKSCDYEFKRLLIETVAGGSHKFVSVGQLSKTENVDKKTHVTTKTINDHRAFEGWKHESL
jgi:ClpP class serine protease